MTVRELIQRFPEYGVGYDSSKQLDRVIEFEGAGFYSMDDDEVYRYDKDANTATYSRIRVEER